MKNLLLISALGTSFSLLGMMKEEPSSSTLPVYIIPGLNGFGTSSKYVKLVLGEGIQTIRVGTPTKAIDLGQSWCMSYLDQAIKDNDNKAGFVYANSQGTGTVLNYVAEKDKGEKIKALILEASLASGNSAIYHTATDHMGFGFLKSIPGSYYLAPYCAKAMFPLYWPAGKQPIHSIKDIPTNIPIVLAHSKDDSQLSYKDTCALYYGLRSRGNDNDYFMSLDGVNHIEILSGQTNKQKAVRAILKKHNLMQTNENMGDIDLSEYQPDYTQFKADYDDLVSKERNHDLLGKAGMVAGAFATVKVATSVYKRLNQR